MLVLNADRGLPDFTEAYYRKLQIMRIGEKLCIYLLCFG